MRPHLIDDVAEQLPIALFVVDADGRSAYANDAAKNLLGAGIDHDVPVERLAEVYQAYICGTDELYPADRSPIMRALAGETQITEDMCLRRPGGDIPIHVWATPVRDQSGNIEAAVAAFWDMSRQIEAREELTTALAEQLKHLNDLRVGFLTAVSHEVRTPLASVLGLIETLHTSADRLSPSDRNELIGRAYSNGVRLQALMHDVLDLERLSRGLQ